ncbi:MAG: FkbM family methyltransferase [Thermoanaerobaculia bacterium]|nr:FkbM family methyltransferase [Thermoanaerobaculia bacterium]
MEREAILAKLNRAYFSENPHEKAILEHLGELLAEAKLFVDIGASLGQYTFYASRILENGQIVAIEADPLRYEQLAHNCEQWQTASGNKITAIRAAVAESAGEISFFTTDSDVSGGLFAHPTSAPGVSWRELRVPCLCLDDRFAGQVPDLVKIDVEGAEGRVLAGARRLLAENHTQWLVELHGWDDGAGHGGAEAIYRLFDQLGYRNADFHGADLFTRRPTPALARLRGRLRRLARRLRHAL